MTTALHPLFAARVTGIDIGQPVFDAAWLRDARDRRAGPVFVAPGIAGDAEAAFSKTVGTAEPPKD